MWNYTRQIDGERFNNDIISQIVSGLSAIDPYLFEGHLSIDSLN